MYAQDIRNTMPYDLILNLDRVTLKATSGILECLKVEKDFQITPESRAEVDRLYLATKIEESLVTDPRTVALEIRAEVRNDGIRLIGPYLENSELTMITKIVQTVSDTSNVQYNPGYASKFDNNGYFRNWETDMDKD